MHDLLKEYRQQAQKNLSPAIWTYLDDAGNHANTDALTQFKLMPRPLQDLQGGHTRLQLFGQSFDHPIILAPVAYQKLFHADGELASTLAASAQGGQTVISSLAGQSFKELVACAKTGGLTSSVAAPWFQLYWQAGKDNTHALLGSAVQAGCSAVVFTVDAPVKVSTLTLPANIRAANLPPRTTPMPDNPTVFGDLMAQAPTWSDVHWLRRQTQLPLLVKGLLHPDDAARALDAGCDGIVISNHGGRTLCRAPASIDCLDAIVKRVGGQIPVLFDSGIRSGQDVFTALALGAAAVLVGRPYVWALTVDGAMGVAKVIRLMRDELELTMALTGCATLKDIGRHCLHQ